MRIAMIGTGYVGLVSGACFADFGHHVTCVDKDADKIDGLNAGRMPIWEPGLEALVKANEERGRLAFTTDLAKGMEGAEAVFIAVGTPARRGDGHADLTYVFDAVRELAKVIKPGTVVVTKSTVPVGTGDKIERDPARGGRRGTCRSRPTPNSCAKARRSPISSTPTGSWSAPKTSTRSDVLREIYRPLFLNRAPILITGRRTAELTKYAANAFLAVKISFINEIAEPVRGGRRRRPGRRPRDRARQSHRRQVPSRRARAMAEAASPRTRWRLLQTADAAGVEQRIVRTTVAVNDERKASMVERVDRALGGERRGQEGRDPRPGVQAQHRRHARGAVDPADQGPGRARRAGDRVTIPSRASRPSSAPGIEFADDAYAAAAEADARGDRHRMGRVSGARPQADGAVDARQAPDRPAQRLRSQRGRGGGPGLFRDRSRAAFPA